MEKESENLGTEKEGWLAMTTEEFTQRKFQ